MINAAVITNIPAPYSLDLFNMIQERNNDIELNMVFSAMSRSNREWSIDTSKCKNIYSLDSLIFQGKQGEYRRFIHIPKGTWHLLNKINPNILIVYEYSLASFLSFLWCKAHKKKYVHVTEGTIWSERGIGYIQRALRRIIIRNSDALIACSSKAKEKLLEWGANSSDVSIVLLTTNTRKFIELQRSEENKQTYNILYVGNISKQKGIDLLIEGLYRSDGYINLWIVGSGTKEYVEQINSQVKDRGLDNRVTFFGFTEGEDLLSLYKKANAFVLPSREDCYGLVLVEAYCSRLPILASKYADGAYDIVEEGTNGLIIDPFDSEGFGKSINAIVNNKEFFINAQNMDFEKFSIENEAIGFETVIYNTIRS